MIKYFGWPEHTSPYEANHNPSLGMFTFMGDNPRDYALWCRKNWNTDKFDAFCIMPRQGWFVADGVMLRNGASECTKRTIAYNILEGFSGYDLIKTWVSDVYSELADYPVKVIGGDLETPKCTLNYTYKGEKSKHPQDLNTTIKMREVIEFLVYYYPELIPDINYDLVLNDKNAFNSYASRQVMQAWNNFVYAKLATKQTEIFYDSAAEVWPDVEMVNWDMSFYKDVPPEQPLSGLPMPNFIVGTACNPVLYKGQEGHTGDRFRKLEDLFAFLDMVDDAFPIIPWVQSWYQADKADATVTHEEIAIIRNTLEENYPHIKYALEW